MQHEIPLDGPVPQVATRKAPQPGSCRAERSLRAKEKDRLASGNDPFYSDVRLGHLRRAVLEEPEAGTPDERTKRWVKSYSWRRNLNATTSRRLTNVETRLRDYPDPARTLPTRLGNVIRRHEDNTGERDLESFVQRVWHTPPFSLQVQHDEYRSRLDLYCTMVFTFPVLAALAVVRLRAYGDYASAIILVLLVMCWWTYRAAIASARAWGQTLESSPGTSNNSARDAAAAAASAADTATARQASARRWHRLGFFPARHSA